MHQALRPPIDRRRGNSEAFPRGKIRAPAEPAPLNPINSHILIVEIIIFGIMIIKGML